MSEFFQLIIIIVIQMAGQLLKLHYPVGFCLIFGFTCHVNRGSNGSLWELFHWLNCFRSTCNVYFFPGSDCGRRTCLSGTLWITACK